MLRWILGAVACLIAGVMMLSRYYSDVPALEQLTPVTGDVASANVEIVRTRRMQSQLLAVIIGDKPVAYYLERFPDFERIVGTIKPGDHVTAWVDVGRNNYVWQFEKGGERLVSYEQVAEAQESNNRNNAWFGIFFVVVGLGILVVVTWRWKMGLPAPSWK